MIRVCAATKTVERGDPPRAAGRAAVGVLELLGLPAAVLGRAAQVIAANARFERLLPELAREGRNRLQLVHATADAQLSETLLRMAARPDRDDTQSIPVPGGERRPPTILHLVAAQHTRAWFPGALAILVVLRLVPRDVPDATVLQGLFDLTPAEARVAVGVAQRHTIDQVAAGLGLSQETVRTQLKAVLAKTGAARNIDLAVMLAGASLRPAGRSE